VLASRNFVPRFVAPIEETGATVMKEIAEWIEREALRDLAEAAQRAGLSVLAEQAGDVLVLRSAGLDSVLFNRILGLGEGSEVTAGQLERWLDAYRDAAVTRFFVHLYDEPRPARWLAWLEARGVVRYQRSWDQLVRGRDEPLPSVSTPFVVRPARAADAPAVAELFAASFDLPPAGGRAFAALIDRPGWHVDVGADGDDVVAAGVLFVSGDVAYLAGGATRPSQRGRGAQLALLAERCRRALDLGCRVIVSETGAPVAGDPQHSHHNLQRSGLRVFATRHNYALRGFAWPHGRMAPATPAR
jgi:hypothetical protein